MNRPHHRGTSLQRLEIMEEESRLRKEINLLRFKRQDLISDIKQKRTMVGEFREKRDTLNGEVKDLVAKGKEHIKARNRFQSKVRKLKEQRSDLTKGIKPKADMIRSGKEERRKLNREARTSKEDIKADFDASLKTLFEMDLSLRDEVIMVEMIMDVQKRYLARKSADGVSDSIHETWKGIKEIEDQATNVTTEIISLATDGEKEHQAAMELFDRKDELGAQSQEFHERYIGLTKEIRTTSRTIDGLSKEIDELIRKIKPIQNRLDNARITRRDEQQLEQLKMAKDKMATSGKIDLNDLRVLMESKALDLSGSVTKNDGGEKEHRSSDTKRASGPEHRPMFDKKRRTGPKKKPRNSEADG